ncbi:hypothetical protein DIPPA_03851 [Diplonema papillatum]|nr:hypothetical protein DIPPA_03851 [Diplonema papillatum]
MWRPTLSVVGCHSFERGHIERYFDCGYRCCPISRAAMTKGDLHPNDALRAEIRAWVVDNVPGGRALLRRRRGHDTARCIFQPLVIRRQPAGRCVVAEA